MKFILVAACTGLCVTPSELQTLTAGVAALQMQLNETEAKAQYWERMYREEKKKLCS